MCLYFHTSSVHFHVFPECRRASSQKNCLWNFTEGIWANLTCCAVPGLLITIGWHCMFYSSRLRYSKQLLHPDPPHIITMIPVGRFFSIIRFSCGLVLVSSWKRVLVPQQVYLYLKLNVGWLEDPITRFDCSCWKSRKSPAGNQGWWRGGKRSKSTTGLPSE